MGYEEAIEKVNSLLRFGMKPGLERVAALLQRLENPQEGLRFVHVAGTNGKGSTCALLASVLHSAGLKTGLFTSPYVNDFCERMQIDGEMIPHAELAALVEELFPLTEELAAAGEIITEFEFITAMAMLWFSRRGCEAVVLEVGLGGRFDATNVISRAEVSVITSISLDHTAILGDSVEQIAFEKSGIMKRGGVCVCYPDQPRGALGVLKTTAEVMKNRFVVSTLNDMALLGTSLRGTQLLWNNLPLELPLLGEHQVKNLCTALAAIAELRVKGWSITDEAVQAGVRGVSFPARLELLSLMPLVLLDGAHNPDGTAALSAALRTHLRVKTTVCVMGMLADKDVKTAVRNLRGLFKRVYTVTPKNPRAMPAGELAGLWWGEGAEAVAMSGAEAALQAALETAGESGAVVICGSLYLAGDLRPAALKLLKRR